MHRSVLLSAEPAPKYVTQGFKLPTPSNLLRNLLTATQPPYLHACHEAH